MNTKFSDRALITVIIIILLFSLFNFNESLGAAFGLMIISYGLFRVFDKKDTFPFIRNNINFGKSIIYALGAYVIFIFIIQIANYIATSFFAAGFLPGQATFSSTVTYLSSQLLANQQPALAGNQILTFLAYALAIPFVESLFFFGALMESGVDFFLIRPSLKNVKTWSIIAIISSIFALFHISARIGAGASGQLSSALSTVFLFAVVSCILVVITGQVLEAILFHVIANSVALIVNFSSAIPNILYLILMGGGVVAGLLFILKKTNVGKYLSIGRNQYVTQ